MEGKMMETGIVKVEGMSCGHCEAVVNDAVRKLPGIKKVKASKRKKQVVVKYNADEVTLEEIKSAITSAGYDVIE